jgi:hypothetical protein
MHKWWHSCIEACLNRMIEVVRQAILEQLFFAVMRARKGGYAKACLLMHKI